MGIPRLIGTLEAWAIPGTIYGEHVVIDGPAFAYHILSVLRRNQISQPSGALLGRIAIKWLDELASQGVTMYVVDDGITYEIEEHNEANSRPRDALFFDGYLPSTKLSERMQRMVKASVELTQFRSSYPQGCPSKYVSGDHTTEPLLFTVNEPGRHVPSPTFLVPAVLDALRKCPRYQTLVHVVPGEADAFCATRLKSDGGVVLTSDSDLLVHDVGDGRVAFFRDIYAIEKDAEENQMKWNFSIFDTHDILSRNGLSPSVDARRLGYEIYRGGGHVGFNAVVISCLQAPDLTDDEAFKEFCQQYVNHEISLLPKTSRGDTLAVSSLDPRISEMVLQLGGWSREREREEDDIVMFLPVLIEDQVIGSAWIPSTPIRQLAYSIFTWLFAEEKRQWPPVMEYRRVQTIGQRGRGVNIMSKPAAQGVAKDLLKSMEKIKLFTGGTGITFWTLLCLATNIQECQEQEKQSHCLLVLEEARSSSPPRNFHNLPWGLIHFNAHLQASHYSFRILSQILSLVPDSDWGSIPEEIIKLRDELSQLPTIDDFPEFDKTTKFLRKMNELKVLEILGHLIDVPESKAQHTAETRKAKKRKKSREAIESASKRASKQKSSDNMFSVLENE